MEKYLLTKLYDRTFAQDVLDRERDQILAARLAALQFIRPEHLEIADDFAGDGTLALAQKELKKINMYKVGAGGMGRLSTRAGQLALAPPTLLWIFGFLEHLETATSGAEEGEEVQGKGRVV